MFKSLTCLADKTKLGLKGGTYEIEGSIVIISVKTCKGHDYCRSEEEIDQFIATHSLVFAMN